MEIEKETRETVQQVILLVDDEPMILEIFSEVLRDAGFDVDTASNGNEALLKATERKYDLILLDIMMNDGPDGIEVLKTIKSDKEKYHNPIVVMLTNISIANNIKDALYYGAEGYLVKVSLSNELLVKNVKGYLKGFRD
jgi:CheY-like chemotaxis protein